MFNRTIPAEDEVYSFENVRTEEKRASVCTIEIYFLIERLQNRTENESDESDNSWYSGLNTKLLGSV